MTTQYMTEIEKEDIRFTRFANNSIIAATIVAGLTAFTALLFAVTALVKMWV